MSSGTHPGSAQRWNRVQDVFAIAIECDASRRAELLDRECGNDARLRREVESLLDGHERSGLLDQPAVWRTRMDEMEWAGRTVAQYRVLEPIGAGAMGLVFKARDERLGRHVALKFLPPHLSIQEDARKRFLLEARAAAALDHPNICTIHEIGEADNGQPFIAMALYEGETLQERVSRAPLAWSEAVTIALQIAAGLAKAHEQGVVHRDLKPSNVMLLPDGTVKVLDFGVASMADASLTSAEGAAIGTLAYMSPEQARGDPVDARMDVWSLGVVLYEMISGTRPFRAENANALSVAILTSTPEPLSAARADVPRELDELVGKALAKTLEQRYASMAQMAADLADVAERERARARDITGTGDTTSAVAPTGERRRVVVLVNLLSGYAALIERLAPEKLEEIARQVREAAIETAGRHGGLVNYAFDEEVVCLFGIPTGHEDDDLRAVRAAMELHARVSNLSSTTGVRLSVQSGIHAARLIVRRLDAGPYRYGLTGPAAQLADRLAALAPSGTILVSPECQRLVAPFVETVRHDVRVALDDASPVAPYRVTGESGLQTRLEAAARKGLTPYAGRQDELAALDAHLAQARAGHGQVVLVLGEAGLGKSRLLHELRERLDVSEVRVVQARCLSSGGAAPYLPFVASLRDLLHLQGSEARTASVEDTVARILAIDQTLRLFVPLYLHLLSMPSEAYPLPRHLRGEHLQAAIAEALTAILTLAARERPTVLLFEDWHWSDDGSREALRSLIEAAAAHRLLIVVTSRPQSGAAGDDSSHVRRLQLAPLDYATSVRIMQDVFGVQRLSDDLAHALYERTSGNPFFLEEICQALLEQGAVIRRDGEGIAVSGVDTLCLPDTVQAVIRTRLDSLDERTLEVLRVASVIGREFSRELLIAALSSTPDAALDRLKTAGLIQQVSFEPDVICRFRHVLLQEVTYDSLLGHQRRSLHHVIGQAIERRHAAGIDDHAELLAHHFERAEEWHSAVRYGVKAAERAGALSEFAEALATLDRVREWLSHLPEDEARCELVADVLLRQERLCETLGQRKRQRQIVSELIALLAPRGPSSRLAQAYLRQGDLLTLLKKFDAADRALSTGLRISREQGDATLERQALRSIGLLRWHEERHGDALALAESALAIDRQRSENLAIAGDLANRGVIYKSIGEREGSQESLASALASFEEALSIPALAIPAATQDPTTLLYCLQNIANAYRTLGDLDRALEYLQRANDIARANLLPIQRSFHLMGIAHIFLQQGRIDESLRTYEESVQLSRRARHADGLVQSLRALGELLFGLGREAEALPYLEEAARLFSQLEDDAGEVEMTTHIAVVLERLSRFESATEAWEKVRAMRAAAGNAQGELDALEGIARTLRQRGGPESQVIPAFEAALSLAARLGERRRELSVRNTLGILQWEAGRYTEALRHYEAALGLVRELADRAHEGLILNSLGVTLIRLNRHEEAQTVLERSIALTRETGEHLLEAHALAALGDVCQARGRRGAARECFERSLELRRIAGDERGERAMRLRIAQCD